MSGKYNTINAIGNDKYLKAIVVLLKSSDIAMFFASTAIALLVSCSWEEKHKQRHLWLMVYVFCAAIFYAFTSYIEYSKTEINTFIVCLLNIAMFLVMIYIIYNACRGRRYSKEGRI